MHIISYKTSHEREKIDLMTRKAYLTPIRLANLDEIWSQVAQRILGNIREELRAGTTKEEDAHR